MRLLAATVVALVVAAAAGAVTYPYWTPAKMSRTLVAKNVPPLAVSSTITKATCRGVAPARHALFNRFRCAVTWRSGVGSINTVTVWARPLAGGRVCTSTKSLATCTAQGAPVTGVITAEGLTAATLLTVRQHLLPSYHLTNPYAIQVTFTTCAQKGPTVWDCDFTSSSLPASAASVSWTGHANVTYAAVAGGYKLTAATLTNLVCRPGTAGGC